MARIGFPAAKIDGGAPTAVISRTTTLAIIFWRMAPQWTARLIGGSIRCDRRPIGGGRVADGCMLALYR